VETFPICCQGWPAGMGTRLSVPKMVRELNVEARAELRLKNPKRKIPIFFISKFIIKSHHTGQEFPQLKV